MSRVWTKVIAALVCLLVMSTACSAIAWFKKPRVITTEVVKSSVLVFPFDAATDVQMGAPVAKALAGAARDRLQKTGKYQVVVFSEQFAPVQRAVEVDQVLKADQLKGPFAEDMQKTLLIGRLSSVDYVLVGTVESYTVDPDGKSVSVVLSAQMVDTRNGKIISAYTAKGKSSDPVAGIDPSDLRATALADAIAKLGLDAGADEESSDN